MVEWSEAITVAKHVPAAIAHLVPQTRMGSCKHTISTKFIGNIDAWKAAGGK
jgi:hypothetical protein